MELVGGPMASGPTAGVRKAGSGVSADDLALLTTMDAEGLLRAGAHRVCVCACVCALACSGGPQRLHL